MPAGGQAHCKHQQWVGRCDQCKLEMNKSLNSRPGWEWKNGYWSRVVGKSHTHKKSFFCPHCRRPTGTIDDKYLLDIGICAKCYVMYVEERKVPAIDLAKYKKVK